MRIYNIVLKFGATPKIVTGTRLLQKLQKRAVRIISCSPLLAHSEALFIHLKILQFKKLYFYTVSVFMYEHNLLP